MFYFEEVTSTVLKIRVEFTFATQHENKMLSLVIKFLASILKICYIKYVSVIQFG